MKYNSVISVIIPVYNAEEYLDACLASIQDQSMPSFEAIMVDDGSTDSSALICDRYSATDPRFKNIRKPNGGVSSARNAGLEIAQGEYVMFVDSDDALLPSAVPKKGSIIPVITVVSIASPLLFLSVIFSICRRYRLVNRATKKEGHG